ALPKCVALEADRLFQQRLRLADRLARQRLPALRPTCSIRRDAALEIERRLAASFGGVAAADAVAAVGVLEIEVALEAVAVAFAEVVGERAAVGAEQGSVERADDRRFAGAVRSDDRGTAGWEAQVERVEGAEAAGVNM